MHSRKQKLVDESEASSSTFRGNVSVFLTFEAPLAIYSSWWMEASEGCDVNREKWWRRLDFCGSFPITFIFVAVFLFVIYHPCLYSPLTCYTMHVLPMGGSSIFCICSVMNEAVCLSTSRVLYLCNVKLRVYMYVVGELLFESPLERGSLIHRISWIEWEYISWWRAHFYHQNGATL